MRTTTRMAVCVAAIVSLLLAATAIAFAGGKPDTARQLADVRRTTAPYHGLERAHADGYEPGSPCVPNMGLHYVRSVAASQDELDPTAPNILVYAPRRDGGLRLVAVEYASWAPAALFGRTFDPPGGSAVHGARSGPCGLWRGRRQRASGSRRRHRRGIRGQPGGRGCAARL